MIILSDVPATYPQVVELKATIGLRGDVGTGSVLFRIFRDENVIYYARLGIESTFEKYYLPTIQAFDVNPPGGSHGRSEFIEKTY